MNKFIIIKVLFKELYPYLIPIFLTIFKFISLKSFISLYLSFNVYIYYTTKTKTYYQKTEFNKKLIESCENIKNANFKQYFFFPYRFMQFILYTKTKINSSKKIEIEKIDNVDEFGSKLQWINYSGKDKIKDIHNKPLILLFPGITGDFNSLYIYNLIVYSLLNNYDVCLFQMRTLSEEMKIDLSKKNFDFYEDIDKIFDYIKKTNQNKIFSIGLSYGANFLSRYLGSKNIETKYINFGVIISNPFDLYISQRNGVGTIYEQLILNFQKNNYNKGIKSLISQRKDILDYNKLYNAESIKDFDNNFFAKILGYRNADSYYRGISSFNYIKNINVPTLIIHSKDDPVTSYQGVPFDDIIENDNLIYIETDKGGHLCFVENETVFKFKQWLYKPVIQFLNFCRDYEKLN